MATVANLVVKLNADISNFSNNMGQAAGGTDKLMKKLGALSIAAGVAFGFMAKSGLGFATDMENLTTDFKVMLGSLEDAEKMVEEMKTMAAKTPFELTGLGESVKQLLAFNVSAEDALPILSQLGDIALGDVNKLASLTRAFGKMNASQKVSLEDINMMIDAGFNPLLLVAEKTGTTMQEVYARISKGEVAFSEITDAIQAATSEGGQFFGGMEEASRTLSGQISTLKDNISMTLGEAFEPLFNFLRDSLVPGINDAIEWFSGLPKPIKITIEVIGAFMLAAAPMMLLLVALPLVIGEIVKSIAILKVALAALSKAVPWLAIIALAIAAVVLIVENWDKIKEFFVELWEKVKMIFSNAWDNIKTTVMGALGFIQQLWEDLRNGVVNTVTMMIETVKNTFEGLWIKIQEVWNNITTWIHDKITAIKTSIDDFITKIREAIEAITSFDGATSAMSKGGIASGMAAGKQGITTGPYVGSYAVGTDFVPRTGLALVHKGERITPANQNSGQTIINITTQTVSNSTVDYLFNRFNAKLGVSV